MGEGDSEGIWDAAMGEMTRWVLHMGRWKERRGKGITDLGVCKGRK